MAWRPARQVAGVQVFDVRGSSGDIRFFHDSFDFCSIEAVEGSRGPTNHYRRWSYDAKPGDLLVFEPGHTHRASCRARADYRVLLVSPALVSEVRQARGAYGDAHFSKPVVAGAYQSFERLHRLIARNGSEEGLVREALVLALDQALAGGDAGGRSERVDGRLVRRALEFIEEFLRGNPEDHLDLEDMADQLSAGNQTRLIRTFSKATHVGVYEYFKLRKFAYAKRALVEQPARSVEHLAWDLGYTINSFSRAFRGLFGVSPRAYRAAFRCPVP
jgi:AraC-like DNA-binding protein